MVSSPLDPYLVARNIHRVNWNVTMTARICAVALFICAASASAEDMKHADELAVVEIGAAPSWNLTDRASSFGPTIAVEVTPIQNWLELEAGLTPAFGQHTTEWTTDLLFKKPWTLSRTVEFMAGIGPEWIHTGNGHTATDSVGAEAVLDFMFWPRQWRHKFGWYLEPGYEYNFGRGHERSIGISFGLLIAVRNSGNSR